MATIGIDCEIILDGSGYFLKPGSYVMHRPRIRKASVRADGGESYVDLGPGKREWSLCLLCLNELLNYDGTPNSKDGQGFRDTLLSSYTGSAGSTINFIEPTNGTAIAVHFDSYSERILDLHSQIVNLVGGGGTPRLSYEVIVVLVEA
jgi:hypothetical protein